MAETTQIDPVTLSVIRGRFEQIVGEMDTVLVRSAFSPIIAEANDMTNGLFRSDGRTIVQGDLGLPIFTGNMEFTVKAIVDQFKDDINPGDVFITNDPYIGGTHLMDVKVVKPYFVDGELVTFMATTGHWTDIGSIVPGGFNGETTSIYQEGVRIPPLKLYDAGDKNEEVLELTFTNVRRRDDIEGDFKAQMNALTVGEQRLDSLIEEYDVETVKKAIRELEDRSEQQMRSHIEEIPDGVYEYTDYMDNDGITDEPLPIHLTMEIDKSDIQLDFAGTAPPAAGPINAPRSCTVSACNIAFKHIYPDIPTNSGCFAPLQIDVPAESFINAKPPQPTVGYTETSQRVLDVVFGALAKAIPSKVPAQSFSTSGSLIVSGQAEDEEYMLVLPMSGGYGATHNQDGLNHCTPPYARAQSPTIEVMENQYPIRFQEHLLRQDSSGAGRRRGGLGTSYEFEVADDNASASLVGDRADHTPSGVAGGKNAKGAEFTFIRDGEELQLEMRTKTQDFPLNEGSRVRMKSPGGGGHGTPLNREVERVLEDVQQGYITVEHAADEYGVIIDTDENGYAIDHEATEKLRHEQRDGI